MAAEKKGQTIVIKKVYVTAGHHGGAWKVALADFMTAMMAFFLVMWLIGQSEQTKKAVSDYFSTPSILEYNYQNFGAEITLEKLFLDFINEPLKAVQSFVEPADIQPNLLDQGSQKVVASYLADQLTDIAKSVVVDPDGFEYYIEDDQLFLPGTATPKPEAVNIMAKIKVIMSGLEDARVDIRSLLFKESVSMSSETLARNVAIERQVVIVQQIKSFLEHSSVSVNGTSMVNSKKDFIPGQSERPKGLIHIKVTQNSVTSDGKPTRKLQALFGEKDQTLDVYRDFKSRSSNQNKTRNE